jgi:hypothetical protein
MASNLNTSKPWSEMDLALNALDRGYSIELIAGYRLPDDHETPPGTWQPAHCGVNQR